MSPGDFVQTPDGPGVILSVQSARDSATVKLDNGELRSYPLSQLTLTETGEPPIVPNKH